MAKQYYLVVHPERLEGNIHVTRTTAGGNRVPLQLIPGQLLTPANVRQLEPRIVARYLKLISVRASEKYSSFGVRFLTTSVNKFTYLPVQEELFPDERA